MEEEDCRFAGEEGVVLLSSGKYRPMSREGNT